MLGVGNAWRLYVVWGNMTGTGMAVVELDGEDVGNVFKLGIYIETYC